MDIYTCAYTFLQYLPTYISHNNYANRNKFHRWKKYKQKINNPHIWCHPVFSTQNNPFIFGNPFPVDSTYLSFLKPPMFI